MSEKIKCESDSANKKRKWLTLEQKLNIIKLYEDGATFAKIGKLYGTNYHFLYVVSSLISTVSNSTAKRWNRLTVLFEVFLYYK